MSAEGSLPRHGEYCAKYVDTDPQRPAPTSATKYVDLAPGEYTLRSPDDTVTFLYRDGVVASSHLEQSRYPTLEAVANELLRQHKETIALTALLARQLHGWQRGPCINAAPTVPSSVQPSKLAVETRCSFNVPSSYGHLNARRDGYAPPVPVAALEALGCTHGRMRASRGALSCNVTRADATVAEVHVFRPMSAAVDTATVWVASPLRTDDVDDAFRDSDTCSGCVTRLDTYF